MIKNQKGRIFSSSSIVCQLNYIWRTFKPKNKTQIHMFFPIQIFSRYRKQKWIKKDRK